MQVQVVPAQAQVPPLREFMAVAARSTTASIVNILKCKGLQRLADALAGVGREKCAGSEMANAGPGCGPAISSDESDELLCANANVLDKANTMAKAKVEDFIAVTSWAVGGYLLPARRPIAPALGAVLLLPTVTGSKPMAARI